jgi:hypothetical protein
MKLIDQEDTGISHDTIIIYQYQGKKLCFTTSDNSMENERVKRYPHINVNALKAVFPQDNNASETKKKKGARKGEKKPKRKLSKAQQQSLLVSGTPNIDVIGRYPDIDDPEKSDGDEIAVITDLSATDVDEAVDMDEEEEENEPQLLSAIYSPPCDVIQWKKMSKDSVIIGLPYDAAFYFKGCLQVRFADPRQFGLDLCKDLWN